jgi:hypothetical protein
MMSIRMSSHNRVIVSFLVQFLLKISSVTSIEPLGSKVPDQCSVSKMSCPSHYMCVSMDTTSTIGKCICDRFFGFYGPDCRKLSSASYLFLVLCGIVVIIAVFIIAYSLSLLIFIRSRNKLKSSTGIVTTTLIFNSVAILGPLGVYVGYSLVILEIDRDSYFLEYIEV